MNQRHFPFFAFFILVITFQPALCQKVNNSDWIKDVISRSSDQLLSAAETYKDSLKCPRTFENGRVKIVGADDWTSGFFPGSLWDMYEITKNEKFKTEAQRYTAFLESAKFNKGTHDLGFILYKSYGNGYRLTGDENYKQILLTGAKSLLTRYNS